MSSRLRVPAEIQPLFTALEVSPEPVFVTDRHNRLIFWNKSAERLLGYTSEEAVATSCASLLKGCDVYGNRYCDQTCPITQAAVRGETVRHFDLRLQAKDKRTVVVDVSILTFTLAPPDYFFLAHILTPSKSLEPVSQHPETGESPARFRLIVAQQSPDARARKLTAREVEVIGMLAAGHTTPEIASRLHISTLTARNHIQNILDKLELHSKAEAVAFAFQKKLL